MFASLNGSGAMVLEECEPFLSGLKRLERSALESWCSQKMIPSLLQQRI